MRAAIVTSAGFSVADVEEPVARRGQVLVQVRHASVNPVDWKLAKARVLLALRAGGGPYVAGMDFCGTVVGVGAGVEGFVKGDLVAGASQGIKGQRGAFAERVCVAAPQVTKVPAGVPADVAACLPIVGTTAWQSLFEIGGLVAGQRALILGASGGVGHIAVQLAKAHGAHVTGVCSARNLETARALGCDVVIDYGAQDPMSLTERFDVVFDTIGSYPGRACRKLRTPAGVHVSVQPGPSTFFGGSRSRGMIARLDASLLKHVLVDVAAGKVPPIIAARFPLAQIADAIAQGETHRTVGKIVIDV